MLMPKHTQEGLTLIELVVTVSIALVLFGGAIAGFIRFNDRQNVINTVSGVKQVLESSRTRARVRDNPDQSGCPQLQGYRVRNNGTTLQSSILCGLSKFNVTEGQVRSTYQIPSGVSVTNMNITFYTLAGSALVTLPANNNIRVNGTNTYYLFQVQASGQITEGCFVPTAGSTTCIN